MKGLDKPLIENFGNKTVYRQDVPVCEKSIFLKGEVDINLASKIAKTEKKTVFLLGDSEIVDSEVVQDLISQAVQEALHQQLEDIKNRIAPVGGLIPYSKKQDHFGHGVLYCLGIIGEVESLGK